MSDYKEQIKECYRVLEEKKAEDIKILYLGEKSSVADYFIIASGLADPHINALKNALHELFLEENIHFKNKHDTPKTGWIAVDAFYFVVHLFSREMREYYSLETLWKDAKEISVEDL